MYFFHYYVGNTELTAVIAGISTFVPLLGTLTVPLLARRMKKRHVYLVASAVNLLGMGIMMVSGAHVLGLIVGAVILPRRRPTHGYLFLDAGRPGGLRRVENRD